MVLRDKNGRFLKRKRVLVPRKKKGNFSQDEVENIDACGPPPTETVESKGTK